MIDYSPTIDSRGESILKKKDRPIHLKKSFLIPLALVFCGLVLSFVYLTFDRSQKLIDLGTEQTVNSVRNMFEQKILEDSSMLEAIAHALLRNRDIESALTESNRAQLLALSTPIYNELNKGHMITHMYFHSVDRQNILRVHKPERYGDKINRFTMLEAESMGTTSYGIELGVLGTFTLRHVSPWYDSNQKLIGHLELGMEIDSVLESIEQFYSIHLYMLIHKKHLNKNQWIEGMRMLGYNSDWDNLDQYVVTNLGKGQSLPEDFTAKYTSTEAMSTGRFDLDIKGLKHRARVIPVEDKGKRDVGNMWILIDTEEEFESSLNITIIATFIALILGASLFALFFRLVSGIESELTRQQLVLRHTATKDVLTGIYNRRSFDTIITEELERARRYKRDLSVLILDIDHFKHVNDSFGHIAGDYVLSEVANRLSKQLRSHDHLARYGGEEFAIILPETPMEMAHLLAERIRKETGKEKYNVGSDNIQLSMSIGVSSYPDHSATIEELINHADCALYEAKETGRNKVCDFKPELSVHAKG